jgi:hypothetical protein
VACGDTGVSRDGLMSEPTQLQHPTSRPANNRPSTATNMPQRTKAINWKGLVVGAATLGTVINTIVTNGSNADQLGHYQQLQNEQRMEQSLTDATAQSAYESTRSVEDRRQ